MKLSFCHDIFMFNNISEFFFITSSLICFHYSWLMSFFLRFVLRSQTFTVMTCEFQGQIHSFWDSSEVATLPNLSFKTLKCGEAPWYFLIFFVILVICKLKVWKWVFREQVTLMTTIVSFRCLDNIESLSIYFQYFDFRIDCCLKVGKWKRI